MFYQIVLNRDCNFRCKYCAQSVKTNAVISSDCLDQTLAFIGNNFLENKKANEDMLKYNMTGGEPLLHFENVKRAIDYFSRFTDEHGLRDPYFELSTNLFLLNEENMRYLIEHNCNFYIGFDGVEAAFASGRVHKVEYINNFKTVYDNIHILYNTYPKKGNIILNMVISPRNIAFLYESFNFIYTTFNGITISMNIAYNEDWNHESLITLKEQMRLLAVRYCDIMEKDKHFRLGLLDNQIGSNIFGTLSPSCGGGESGISFDTDGAIYACGNFIGCGIEKTENNNVVIGTVYTGIDKNLLRQFLESLRTIDTGDCARCEFHTRCHTGCPYVNYMGSGSMYTIAGKHCEINKAMVITADTIIDILVRTNNDILEQRILRRRA
jgi:radical SAM protein with 4Fe4S-binding SPASM domain